MNTPVQIPTSQRGPVLRKVLFVCIGIAMTAVCVVAPTFAQPTSTPAEIKLPFFVWFDGDSDEVASGDPGVAVAAMCLRSFATARASFTGYTDRAGDTNYNLELSRRRAEHVRSALLAQGLPDGRLSAPLAAGEDPDLPDGSTNPIGRRVEIVIAGPASDLPRTCPAGETLCQPRPGGPDRGPCLSEWR